MSMQRRAAAHKGNAMHTFRIVTCGSSEFFEFLKALEQNVFQVFQVYPVIYDIGLSESERSQLKSDVRRIAVPPDFRDLTPRGIIRASHKPDCLMDFLASHAEDCLFVDADVLFTATIDPREFRGADLAVTPRGGRERTDPKYLALGLLNTGVMFFRNTPPVHNLVRQWHQHCLEEDRGDQLAMSRMLGESVSLLDGPGEQHWKDVRVRLLDPEVYNDVSGRTGKVLHFKNAGRLGKPLKKYRRFVKYQSRHPFLVSVMVGSRRGLRGLRLAIANFVSR